MARRSKSSTNVQKLLEERHAIAKWLDRLSKAKETAADEVQAKVRADYETRLTAVTEQLQGYTKELGESLLTQREQQQELAARETTTDERLAEAKLRHAVGEYDDAKWNTASSEIQSELTEIRQELQIVNDEIVRLEDVLQSMGATQVSEPAKRAVGSDHASKTKKERESFDELEFLKKVASDDKPARRSGAQFTPKELPELITEAAIRRETPAKLVSDVDETESRTLKCDECGTMNRPTEWYCESCGAELAAL
ncbi:MAG: zinc finger Ran-binding domain-containing protein [Gemmatimonadetes bacterium]|nr:zinc finger Ran-binding domain-containing protein [Gemmatimonadota bacterium]